MTNTCTLYKDTHTGCSLGIGDWRISPSTTQNSPAKFCSFPERASSFVIILLLLYAVLLLLQFLMKTLHMHFLSRIVSIFAVTVRHIRFCFLNVTILVVRNRKIFLYLSFSLFLNPFIPKRDFNVTSPYNSNTLQSRQVTRVKIIINWGILH